MKRILFIIFMLVLYNTAYAEFIKPIDNIISTKATLQDANKKSDALNGEVHFHYNSVYWADYGQEVAELYDNTYGGFFLKIEFVVQGKNGALKQYYHIPQQEVKKLLTMATSFNKDTYMQLLIPVTAVIEKSGNKELINYYDHQFKAYTNNGKFILEWENADKNGIKEQLSFDQAVLLKVWQVLLQNTVY